MPWRQARRWRATAGGYAGINVDRQIDSEILCDCVKRMRVPGDWMGGNSRSGRGVIESKNCNHRSFDDVVTRTVLTRTVVFSSALAGQATEYLQLVDAWHGRRHGRWTSRCAQASKEGNHTGRGTEKVAFHIICHASVGQGVRAHWRWGGGAEMWQCRCTVVWHERKHLHHVVTDHVQRGTTDLLGY